MKGKILGKSLLIILFALVLGFLDLPPDTKNQYAPWAPQELREQKINLGLDLQGGSALDYKIDLREVPFEDRKMVVQGNFDIVNRRVNKLGVSEPNIYISAIGDETHINVELAGVDIEEAKAMIGKVVQLEFKEEKQAMNPNELQEIETAANETLQRLKSGDFELIGQEEELANPGKVTYAKQEEWQFADEIGSSLSTKLENLSPGQVYDGTIDSNEGMTVDQTGQFVNITGLNIVRLLEVQEAERTKSVERSVQVSHILVSHKDANSPDPEITRTKDEAKALAEEVLNKLNEEDADFAAIAAEYSDDASNKDTGGVLISPVVEGQGQYVAEFEEASYALTEKDEIAPITETDFGFHLIKAGTIIEASETVETENQYKYEKVFFSTVPDPWQETGLTGKHFDRADVDFTPAYQPIVRIKFNSEGAKLFEEITARNIDKPVAIFVGGDLISYPRVNATIYGGEAYIEGNFTIEEAKDLEKELNTGTVFAPMVLAGEYTIGASLAEESLNKSLWAGIIGLIFLAAYMIFYYRLKGIIAVVALGIYSTMLIFLIQSQLNTIIAAVIAVSMFVFLMAKILNSKENGWEKLLTSILAVFALFFIVYLLANPIVLTLAGVAGVILSIGMAVDANVLIFERIKEELRNGRTYGSALDIGFDRAWHSIRDSNFSSLITCAILFFFGSSIIQGFAFNLAAGILISMFTAITITKTFLKLLVGTKIGKNAFLVPGNKKVVAKKPLKIIENSRLWFGFSGIIMAICLVSVLTFGLKLGIDFEGGTLMHIKFDKQVSQEELQTALEEIGQDISDSKPEETEETGDDAELLSYQTAYAQSTETAEPPVADAETPADLTAADSEPIDLETVTDDEAVLATTEEEEEKETAILATEQLPNNNEAIITQAEEVIDLGSANILSASENGDEYMIKIKTKGLSNSTHEEILKQLEDKFGPVEETRFANVSATVGETMKYKATMALIIALIAIVLYIAFAFRKIPRNVSPWRFGGSAIVALTHDVLFVVGIYAILGRFFNVEVDALFITALLTILGFSVHDTIVVFDRVRENLKNLSRDVTFNDVANQALTQTMARSINTSISTLFTLVALLVLGSDSIRFFVLALVLGTVVGTYSSIFIASPVLVLWNNRAQNRKGRD